jgi:hypothetical protein
MLEDGENTYELLKVIIPTHHKIRLTYSAAHEWVIRATSYLWWSFQKRAEFLSQLEWDLRLRLSNDYKMELRKLRLAGDDVERVLCRAHPKYIWHARLNLGKKALVDMLFDATTVPDAFPVYHITWLDEVFRGLATKPIVAAELAGKAEEFLGRDLMALMS